MKSFLPSLPVLSACLIVIFVCGSVATVAVVPGHFSVRQWAKTIGQKINNYLPLAGFQPEEQIADGLGNGEIARQSSAPKADGNNGSKAQSNAAQSDRNGQSKLPGQPPHSFNESRQQNAELPQTATSGISINQQTLLASTPVVITPTPDPLSTTESTPVPSPTATMEPSPTPTLDPAARSVRLSSVTVEPGQSFQLELICDPLEDLAGGDFAISFDTTQIDLTGVRKSATAEPLLLMQKKSAGRYVVSLAGTEPVRGNDLVLLSFDGVVHATQSSVLEVRLEQARIYSIESQQFPVQIQHGKVIVSAAESEPDEQPTYFGNDEATPVAPEKSLPATVVIETPLPVQVTPQPEQPTHPGNEGDPTAIWIDLPPAIEVSTGTATLAATQSVPTPTISNTPSTHDLGLFPEGMDFNHDNQIDYLDIFQFALNWQQQRD